MVLNEQEAGDQAGVARLLRVATAADPTRGRAIRAALASDRSPTCRGSPLDRPGQSAGDHRQRLAYGLGQPGDATRAIELLRHLRLRHPGDFWINVTSRIA